MQLLVGLVLVVLAATAAAVWGYRRDAQRRQLLMQFCAANRWRYCADDPSLTVRWHGTPFGEGDHRRARNVLVGNDRGGPFVAFEYSFVTGGEQGRWGGRRTTHRYAVCALGLPVPLPRLQVEPEGLLRRAGQAGGLGVGVQLESEDFNRRFTVSARQPKFASDVLGPRTLQALLAAPPTAWRIEGADLVSWHEGQLTPVDVLAHLSTLSRVVEGIPSFVWHDNGYDPPEGQPSVPPSEGSVL